MQTSKSKRLVDQGRCRGDSALPWRMGLPPQPCAAQVVTLFLEKNKIKINFQINSLSWIKRD